MPAAKTYGKIALVASESLEAQAALVRLTQRYGNHDVNNADAIVAPTQGPAWLTDLVTGDHVSGGSSTAAAVAGYPSITVPAGAVAGLPVGLSFIGPAWSEGPLLRLAFAFEQATRARLAPRFLERAEDR